MNRNMKQLSVAVLVACTTGAAIAAQNAPTIDAQILVSRAKTQLSKNAAAAMVTQADETFTAKDVIVDADGTSHVRMQRTLFGLPVIGGDVVVHSESDGELREVSHSMYTGLVAKAQTLTQANVTNAKLSKQAAGYAQALFRGYGASAPQSKLVVWAKDMPATLAHDVVINGMAQDGTALESHFVLDAASGQLLASYEGVKTMMPTNLTSNEAMVSQFVRSRISSVRVGDNGELVEHELLNNLSIDADATPGRLISKAAASGTGKGLTVGDVTIGTNSISGGWELRDTTRGSHYTTDLNGSTSNTATGTIYTDADNIWGTNTTSSRKSAAVDVHYGQARTWDFYKNVLGRNGISNDGRGYFSRTHYGTNYVNASWSDQCNCMTYGDGSSASGTIPLVALDVAGHEMTHGVTSRTADLVYAGESGALNEAISDMIGTAVEIYTANPNLGSNFMMGERIYSANQGVANPTTALRYMFKPSRDGRSVDCYTSTVGNLDVHFSSGVGNHWFYLLSQGAVNPSGFNYTPSQLVCSGTTSLTAIGYQAAAKIIYRALSVYMTSGTNYKGARTATLKAATDLYGSTSTQYRAVAAAWSAVNVN